jgi:preprotein translocase subunit YajC
MMTTTDGNSTWIMLGFLALMFAFFYLFIIRPQRKRQQQQAEMTSSLKTGDRVITYSGIYGTIEAMDDDTIVIKVESGTTIRMARVAVAQKQPDSSK